MGTKYLSTGRLKAWEKHLHDYEDKQILDFLNFGWPLSYDKDSPPISSLDNHPLACKHSAATCEFISTKIGKGGIAGLFVQDPLISNLSISLLITVPKQGSDKRRVIHDLSKSVNLCIDSGSFLGQHYNLRLPEVDRIVKFIMLKTKGCLLFKLDLCRACRQITIGPLVGFSFKDVIYFQTRLVFGQRSAVLACQRTNKGAIFAYNTLGFLADMYIDDFFGADIPDRVFVAFIVSNTLLHELGLETAVTSSQSLIHRCYVEG